MTLYCSFSKSPEPSPLSPLKKAWDSRHLATVLLKHLAVHSTTLVGSLGVHGRERGWGCSPTIREGDELRDGQGLRVWGGLDGWRATK
jgi:hypothetical protein